MGRRLVMNVFCSQSAHVEEESYLSVWTKLFFYLFILCVIWNVFLEIANHFGYCYFSAIEDVYTKFCWFSLWNRLRDPSCGSGGAFLLLLTNLWTSNLETKHPIAAVPFKDIMTVIITCGWEELYRLLLSDWSHTNKRFFMGGSWNQGRSLIC